MGREIRHALVPVTLKLGPAVFSPQRPTLKTSPGRRHRSRADSKHIVPDHRVRTRNSGSATIIARLEEISAAQQKLEGQWPSQHKGQSLADRTGREEYVPCIRSSLPGLLLKTPVPADKDASREYSLLPNGNQLYRQPRREQCTIP